MAAWEVHEMPGTHQVSKDLMESLNWLSQADDYLTLSSASFLLRTSHMAFHSVSLRGEHNYETERELGNGAD